MKWFSKVLGLFLLVVFACNVGLSGSKKLLISHFPGARAGRHSPDL